MKASCFLEISHFLLWTASNASKSLIYAFRAIKGFGLTIFAISAFKDSKTSLYIFFHDLEHICQCRLAGNSIAIYDLDFII